MSAVAAHWEKLENDGVRCGLCPHNCRIKTGDTGICLTRTNQDGQLMSTTYGQLVASAMDPVEKKPLFHYKPGSLTFSIASQGCNLVCPFCQNHHLSQALRRGQIEDRSRSYQSPEAVVNAAAQLGSTSISFTYSEPILSFEFARDVAAIAQPRGIDIIFVTNGQANPSPAREMADFLSAANVDLKCFDAGKYKSVLGGSLRATTRTIETFVANRVWVEVTTLVIPGFSDNDAELQQIARFIAGLGTHIPWHVSRFHPDYQWRDRGRTPIQTLRRARDIGISEGLHNVYVGNLPGDEGEKTRCPSCGSITLDRQGYRIVGTAVRDGKCNACGEPVVGVGITS